ncbi:MAG TPA: hypothetical protein VIS95_05555 [Solirubrobacterales bacterium]
MTDTAVDAAQVFAEASPETTGTRTLVWQDPVPTAAAGATMTGMEYMEAIVGGKLPPPPIAVTLRMGPIGVVHGEANVLYRGRRQATAEAYLTAADSGKLLAHGVATCMILS